MRKLLVLFSICLLSATLYAEVKVSLASGDVAVFVSNQWIQANEGAVLNTADKIKTSGNSIAILVVDEKTQIWVNENSELSIASLGQESFFDLLAGKVRSKVKLLQGQKFRIKTPVSVATVRGTDFVTTYEGGLFVFEGRVEFTDAKLKQLIMVAKDQIGSIKKGKMSAPKDMTSEEKAKLEDEWKAFIEKQISKIYEEEQEQTLNLRRDMYEIASEVKNDVRVAKELMNEMKESDFSAGITRRDMYGNVVRFEQYLIRPDDSSYEIVSIIKSKDYTSNISASKRLDIFDMTVTMNTAVPNQLSEWEKSAISMGDTMYPIAVNVAVSNITDSGQTDNNLINDPETETIDSEPDENTVDPNTVTPTPTDPTPVTPTPDPTPVTPTPDPTTVTPTPVNPTPVTPTPDPTPVAPTPVNPTPVTPTPVNPTPVTPTPVTPTPVTPTTVTQNTNVTNSLVNTRTNIISSLISSLIKRMNYMPINVRNISVGPARNQKQKANQNNVIENAIKMQE
ncbi:MAG: FecR family protein [Elusimicrobia bacterium]|nr:FecR family protein [Elusimicrobiota bacterium]